jgi:hypothetical protein
MVRVNVSNCPTICDYIYINNILCIFFVFMYNNKLSAVRHFVVVVVVVVVVSASCIGRVYWFHFPPVSMI